MNDDFFGQRPHIRTSWNPTRLLIRGKLTDKAIEKYRAKGWYSQEFKDARRELMLKKQSKRANRDGSYLIADDGRMIYSPL